MKRNLIISCLMALALLTIGFRAAIKAQQGAPLSTSQPTGKVAEIEAYTKDIDSYVKSKSQAERIFANTADGAKQEAASWREFKSEDERQRADTDKNLNQNAYVWSRDGKIIGANFTFQSPSRDWVNYVMYYYRGDGTLAKSSSTLNTFQGNITVIREDYYDPKGAPLKGTTFCKDLKSQQSKPCGNFEDNPAPLYMNVRQLPFYSLLK